MVALFRGFTMALCASKAQPHIGVDEILRHSFSFCIKISENVLSFRMLLVGGPAIPFRSFLLLRRHALALLIHNTQSKFGFNIAFIRQYLPLFQSTGKVSRLIRT